MATRRNATGTSVRLVAETEQATRRLWVAQANSDTAILIMPSPATPAPGSMAPPRPAAPPVASHVETQPATLAPPSTPSSTPSKSGHGDGRTK
jgi:hypothetical protein